jgi:hypothetical protein
MFSFKGIKHKASKAPGRYLDEMAERVRTILRHLNVPSGGDMAELAARIEDLEEIASELLARMRALNDKLDRGAPAAGRATKSKASARTKAATRR